MRISDYVSEFLIFSHMSLRHRDSPRDSVILSGVKVWTASGLNEIAVRSSHDLNV